MFVTQLTLLAAIAAIGSFDPAGLQAPTAQGAAGTPALADFLLHPVTLLALLIALGSATQDIALDAYRREILPDAELGLGNSVHITAYRIAGLVPGSLSLIMADHLPWDQVFLITALFMLPGALMALVVDEPADVAGRPMTLRAAAIEPFREFLGRAGWRQALWVLAFIFFYKLGDSLCTALATPFYLDLGYTKTEIGVVAKNAGLWASVAGGLLGGLWMLRLGIARALWVFGVVQAVSILGFAWLAASGADAPDTRGFEWLAAWNLEPTEVLRLLRLGWVVGLEAFGVGVGTAAFVAYIASQTHPAYTATQLALFTSFMAVPRTLISATAGYLVDALGWTQFYLLCFALAIPGMLMLYRVAPWRSAIASPQVARSSAP
jgi:PAT family beta-lactamase induction signal transducer AmpG